MAFCKTSVSSIYDHIIEDVISKTRELFADEGIDEQVLEDLKSLWRTKLSATKAVNSNKIELKPQLKPAAAGCATAISNMNIGLIASKAIKATVTNTAKNSEFESQATANSGNEQSQINNLVQVVSNQDQLIPVQLTLPSSTAGSEPRVLTIFIPSSAFNGLQLQSLISGPILTATAGLPPSVASAILQQHVNAVLQNQHQPSTSKMPQTDGSFHDDSPKSEEKIKNGNLKFVITNTDGKDDTSDDDSSKSDSEIDVEKLEDDMGVVGDEEPLNSDDDVTDEEDPNEIYNTDNIIVCQYDKITRSRSNKWKLYLKDGIMNLNGEDYVFQRAYGDADW